MERPEVLTEPNGPEPQPVTQPIFITPINSSLTLNSGQSTTLSFVLERPNTIPARPVSLSLGSVPSDITAALSAQSLPATESVFSLTLTAPENMTPTEATIELGAESVGVKPAHATVTVNAVASGQVRPAYQLLTVMYAPPGTNGGKSTSQVSYGSGSTTGTTDSISNSFKGGVEVNASIGLSSGSGSDAVSLGVSGDFTVSQTGTTTSQVIINKGTNNQISVNGPGSDGINHGNDLFWLWLNPQLNVTVDHLGNVAWEIGVNGQDMLIQYVYAEWLLNPSLMPPGTAQSLAAAGLTTADYAQILACNPFYAGAAAGDPNTVVPLDPNRFVLTTHSFPYEPPLAADDPVPATTYTQTSSTTTSSTEEVQTQYTLTVSISEGFNLIFNDTLKVTDSFQWTDTSTSTQTTGSTQQASVTVGGPAFGYTGPTDILVYWDTVYSSFMFEFATGSPSVSGTLTDSAGNPVPNTAITLTVGDITLSTFTNSRGQYNFYGSPPGQGTVAAQNQQFPVAVGAGEPSPALRLHPPA
jgi:Carboxypeptidase regulatory-like domain